MTWTPRTSGTDIGLDGVTYGNGTFVAVGHHSAILTSQDDGVTWTSRASGTDLFLHGVTYGNGAFVAVGGYGAILTSQDDGVTWTPRTSGTTEALEAITYANGTFVVVGGSGTVLTSADGVTWTFRISGTDYYLYGVTYGNGTFVAVGYGGTILQSDSFAPPVSYTLTVTKAGTGSGTVTSNPAGINCGADCSETYNQGTSVTLTPTPDSGSTFTGWSGACSGTGTCTVNMTSDKAVTATFTQQPQEQYTLTVIKSGTGSGTVTSSPAGINCGADCSETYSKVQKVKLTAKADADSTFTGWSGGGCSGTKTCTVTVDTAVTVTADFALKIPDISVAQTSLDFGSIKVGKKATKTLKITNNGTGDLSITLSGLEGTDFSIQGSRSITIKAKKSYSLKVLFTPKSAGLQTATLKINSNDPDTPELNIALSGSTVEQPQQYTLTVTKAGTGSGTVTSNPAGINCGADCSEVYNQGTSVTLTATPDSGSTFTGWSGACSGTGACIVTMTSDKAATATFAQQQYTLTVTKAGTGSGTVASNPAGINCGADCSETYNQGTSVTLTATPDSGSTFTGWSGACSGVGTCTLNMTSDKAATATFAQQQYTLTVTKAGTGSGTVASNPAGINCGADCSEVYNHGTSVTLTATPALGSTFEGWSGDGNCSDGVVTMNANKTCTATFNTEVVEYTLTVTKSGTGSGTVTSNPAGINCGADCSEAYNQGTSVTLTPTPDSGSTFTGWSGACSGTGACIVNMTSDKAVTAAFAVSYDGTWNGTTSQGKEFSLTVSNNGIASVKWGISCVLWTCHQRQHFLLLYK